MSDALTFEQALHLVKMEHSRQEANALVTALYARSQITYGIKAGLSAWILISKFVGE